MEGIRFTCVTGDYAVFHDVPGDDETWHDDSWHAVLRPQSIGHRLAIPNSSPWFRAFTKSPSSSLPRSVHKPSKISGLFAVFPRSLISLTSHFESLHPIQPRPTFSLLFSNPSPRITSTSSKSLQLLRKSLCLFPWTTSEKWCSYSPLLFRDISSCLPYTFGHYGY